jgi:hypothetical protein
MTGIFANVIRVSQPFSFSPGVPRTFTRNRGNEEKSSITLCMAGTMVTAGISLFPTVLLISFHFSFRGKGPGMLQFQIIHVRECFAPHCEQAENEPKQQQNSSCQVSNSKVFKIPLSNSRFSIRSFFGGLLGSHSNRCNVCWHTGTDFCWSSMKNTPHSKSLTTGYSNTKGESSLLTFFSLPRFYTVPSVWPSPRVSNVWWRYSANDTIAPTRVRYLFDHFTFMQQSIFYAIKHRLRMAGYRGISCSNRSPVSQLHPGEFLHHTSLSSEDSG